MYNLGSTFVFDEVPILTNVNFYFSATDINF